MNLIYFILNGEEEGEDGDTFWDEETLKTLTFDTFHVF
jgi:hypothetical protein